jgi:uncharacterized membrane protein
VFEFLFKYRPLLFSRGQLRFGTPWLIPTLVLLLAIVIVALAYRRAPASGGQRRTLAVLRLAALGLLALMISRPTLVVPTVVPQQNFLAVLVDDSRSMRIADEGNASRGAAAQRLLGGAGSLPGKLADQFKVQLYRFAGDASRATSVANLNFAGSSTRLGAALDRVRQDFTGQPLAGVVVVSDGADNAGGTLDDAALALKAARIPVYALGMGREHFARDIELSRLDVPARALEGSTLMADLLLTQSGYDNATIPVYVEESGHIVAIDSARLGKDEATTVRVPFTLGGGGLKTLRVRIPPQPGEQVVDNNVREALVFSDPRRRKVLYFEGEPRFEAKFIRRALENDTNVRLVTLQRTAANKFLRLGVETPQELVTGFPKTREELYTYSGVLLGSVEASQFTHDQLQMMRDFVGERGGGLLLLGGRRAFAEGGYAGTPLADAIPFELVSPSQDRGDSAGYFVQVKVTPTPAGRAHPAMQLEGSSEASDRRWATLPPLSIVNRIGSPKAGATTLLLGRPNRGAEVPVLLFQRYGRGKVIAFTAQDSWLWQMAAEIPVEDMTHETLWRQLLRWLAGGVPDPIVVSTSADRVEPGDSVTVSAAVSDSAYASVNGAAVVAYVTDPGGVEDSLPLEWTVLKDGEYRGAFVTRVPGMYHILVRARRAGGSLGTGDAYVEAASLGREFFGAGMRRAALERLADETGGRFYTPANVASLPQDVRYTESGATVFERYELWDMPAFFFLLLLLFGAEWAYRRVRGLA